MRPTVVIADDHPAMLAEVSRLLKVYCDVLAEVENGALAVQAIIEQTPNIAVLDIAMPGMTGIEAVKKLQAMGSSTRIIFMTAQTDPDYIQAADALGAGFVLKSRMRSDLLPAIAKVLDRIAS